MSSSVDEAKVALLRAFTISSPRRNSNSGPMPPTHDRQDLSTTEDSHGTGCVVSLLEASPESPPAARQPTTLQTLQTLPTEVMGTILEHVEDYRLACRKRYKDLESQHKHQYFYGQSANRSVVSGMNGRRELMPPPFYADHLASYCNSTRRMRSVCKAFNEVLIPLVFRDIEITPRWLFALHRGMNIVRDPKEYIKSMDKFLQNMCLHTQHVAITKGNINCTNGARYKLAQLIRCGVRLKTFTWTLQREQTLTQLIPNILFCALRDNPHVGLHILRLDIQYDAMISSLPVQNLLSISTDGTLGNSRAEFLKLLFEARNVERVEYTSCLTTIQPAVLLECVMKVGNGPVKLPAWKELVSFPSDPRYGMIHKVFLGINIEWDFSRLETLTTHLSQPANNGCVLSMMPAEEKARLKKLNLSTHLADSQLPQNGNQIRLLRTALSGLDSLEELVLFGNSFFSFIYYIGEHFGGLKRHLGGLRRLYLYRHVLHRHAWNDPMNDSHTGLAPTYPLNTYFGLACEYDDIWRLVHCCRDLEVLHLDYHGRSGLDESIVRIMELPLLHTLSITIPSHLPEPNPWGREFDYHSPPPHLPISDDIKGYALDIVCTVMQYRPTGSKMRTFELRIGWGSVEEERKGKGKMSSWGVWDNTEILGKGGNARNNGENDGEGDKGKLMVAEMVWGVGNEAFIWWFGRDDDEEFVGDRVRFEW